jgi:hypothetical protein
MELEAAGVTIFLFLLRVSSGKRQQESGESVDLWTPWNLT